ncbi:MAG: GIY-YIG nuclease family protein [Phycisphaerales bacterium]|nr:GIY-YIG nuclease family protein [Phycisphaerales bacterium]
MCKMQQRAFSIKMFMPDGDPDGLRIVEKSNWSGVGVVFNRTDYRSVTRRPEFGKTGIYILVGAREESNLPTIYVGEGDPVRDRLNNHYANKDFWDWAVFFVAKDNSLNKAHVQFLEERLLSKARAAKRCKLENTQAPTPPTLSEAEAADTTNYLLDMLSIFPLLGLGIFEGTEPLDQRPNVTVAPPIEATAGRSETAPRWGEPLFIESRGKKARGYEDVKGFVIVQGSQVCKDETPSIPPYISTLRKFLCDQGVISESNGGLAFTRDYAVNSPSTAAGVILGRSANGRTEWKDKVGVTLKDRQTSVANSDEAGHS